MQDRRILRFHQLSSNVNYPVQMPHQQQKSQRPLRIISFTHLLEKSSDTTMFLLSSQLHAAIKKMKPQPVIQLVL